MRRRRVASLLFGGALLLVIPFGAAPVGALQSSSAGACLHGGWRSLSDAQGQPYRDQGQCVAFLARHPVTLADLAGSFIGGTGSAVQGGGSCLGDGLTFYLTFDTTYSGSASVGTVSLHYQGCAQISVGGPGPFNPGTFRISTNVGSVTGTAFGTATATLDRNFNVTVDIGLSLTVTSGTGAFATTTGSLSLAQDAPPFALTTGTVSA